MELISRQAAIDALERAKQNIRHNIERAIGRAICEILDEVENGIKQLPSAEPKRGRWIEDKGQQTLMQCFIAKGEVWRVCSECGAGHMIGHKYECDKAYHEVHHNFCPNCGADMRQKGENNEGN